jgi:hypothetical protein
MNIVDNFLPQEEFDAIKKIVDSHDFPWFYGENIAGDYDSSDCYFFHDFYRDHQVNSTFFSVVAPILQKIDIKSVLRGKVLLYIGKDKLIEHGRHTDFRFPHKTFILYLNTNNGFTRLHDGQCVNSVENRALFFDGSLEHNSTNCTDQKSRKLIAISYF